MALTDDLIPSSDLVIDSRRAFSGMSDGASGGFGRPSPSPVSFRDPAWDSAEVAASEKTGVPLEILRSIRVNGERSNGDQVSPKGARGVYQFIPTTRDAFLRKYGVDAYSQDPVEQATAAALHLRESYDRTGDWGRSVAGYNGGRSGENGTNRTVENAEYVRRVMGGLPSGGAGMANKEPAAEYFGQRDLASSPKIAPPTMGDYAKKAGSSMLRGIGTIGEAFGDAAAFVANKATGTQDFEGFNPLESTSRKIEESMTEGGRAAAADGFKGDVTDPSTWQAPETAYGAVMAGVDALGNIGSFLLPAALTGGWSLVSKAANLSKMAKAAAAAGDVARAAELTKAASAASRAATAHGAAQGAGMTYGDAANDAKEFAKQTISKMSHAELMEQTPIYRDAINSGADETFARNLVVNRAGQMGGLLAAGPGALGGAMANKLLGQVIGRRAMPSILGGAMGNRAVRAGVEGGLVGLAEGTGEVAEKMGSNAGGNIAVGRDFADNIGRDTLPEGVGGFIAGGHTGAVAGAMSPNPIPPPKPQPNPVAEAAAKPNSPLSRAAAAGNPDIAAQSTDLDAAPVGAAQDPISARVSEIEAAVGDGGLMDRLRTLNEQSPGLTQQVLGAFATAKNPNAPQALREQSLATLEGALDAIGLAAAGRAGAQWQGLAGEQEGSLSGLRAASIAGQQWQGLSAQPVDNAVDNPTPKTAPEVDNRAPVAPAVAVEEPEKPRKTVAAPAVSVKDVAGEDPKLPPAVRQRRAQLSAMVNTGFDVVEQRDGKFFLVNHADNYEMPLENAGDAARATAIISAKVDNEAHQSINSPLNDKNPATEAQIAADNYSKPSVRRFGLTFKTENPAGSTRSGKDASGKAWSIDMNHHYTGIEGTRSSDGGLVDAFLGSGHRIFVIDQIDPKTGKHDEPKVMAGFRSEEEARKAYLSNYSAGWKGLGAITEMTVPQFRKWVKSSAAALPVSPTIKTSQEVKNDGTGSTQGSDQAGGRVRGGNAGLQEQSGGKQSEPASPVDARGAVADQAVVGDDGSRNVSGIPADAASGQGQGGGNLGRLPGGVEKGGQPGEGGVGPRLQENAASRGIPGATENGGAVGDAESGLGGVPVARAARVGQVALDRSTQVAIQNQAAVAGVPEKEAGATQVANPSLPETQALDALLDVFESLTGHRGIAVHNSENDGFEFRGNTFISVDSPHMHVAQTIGHEFKHLTERHPGLKGLYDRLWGMVDNEAGKEAYFKYLFDTHDRIRSRYAGMDAKQAYAAIRPEHAAKLKNEMLADFMGKRFNDRAWLAELGKKKPELFGNFIRDWIRVLGEIIGKLAGRKDKMEGVKNVDLYISQLQEAKAIAMEVAEEWAKMHPGYARRTGVSQAIQAARSADAAFSAKATDGVEIQNHDKWSIYQERSAQVGDGYVRWVEDPDTAYVTDIQAGQKTRGRELLQWLKDTTGKSLYAVGVVDSASEFWDRMEEDGLIDGQTDEDFMSFFGRASFSAKDYNINTSRDDDDEGTFFTADSTTRKTQAGGAYPIAHLHVPDEAVKTDGWRIGDIYVDAGRRREGIASALVDAASKHFGSRPLGATSVFSEDGQKFWDGISKSAKDNDLAEDDYASLQAELDAEMGQAAEPARMPEVEPDVSDAAIRKAGIHAEDAFQPHKWSGGGDQHTLSIKGLYGGNRTVRLAIERISDGAYSTSIEGTWVGPAAEETTGYVSLKGAKAFIDRQIAARELRARGYDLASSLPAEQRAAMRNGWEAINAMGDEFGVRKFHLTSELDTSIQDLAKSMGLTEAYKVTSNEEVNDRDNKTLVIAFTDKATGKTQSGTVSMTRIRGKWHTSASTIEFKKGGLGTAFYQLAVEHLARKGLQLSPEATLSGINTYRRTEQMLAAALRIGISNAMVPHPVQRVYGFQNDAQSDAEHAANLERLLIANLRNVRELVPEFDRLRYHPETGAITFKNGRDAEKVVERLIGHRGEKLTTQTDARAFGLGRTTLARALMTQAMLDGKFQEPESFAEPVTYSARDQAAIEYEAVEARYKGTPQWMKAPNGKPTNLTERQWVQTRTAMFKQWFGDWEKFSGLPGGVWSDGKGEVSKVVDENGEPLVVYHGSDKGGFMAFETPGGKRRGDMGIFTTSDYDMARSYVRKGRANDVEAPEVPSNRDDLEERGYQFASHELDDTEFRVRSESGSLFTRSSMEQAQQTADRVGGTVTRVDPGHVDYLYTDTDGYEAGPFSSESEAVQHALENFVDSETGRAGDQPGIYALFVNLRNPSETDFGGATWSGSREHQWVVEVGGEIQSDANGTQYFNSKEDAADFAQTFVADDAEGDDADPLSYVRGADDHYESTDDAAREAWLFDNDGAIIRNVIDDGGGPSRYMGEPRDVFVARRGGQLKSANWNTGEFGTSTDDLRFSKKTDTQSPPLQPRASRITDLARQNVVSTRSPTGARAVENQMTNMLTGTFDAFGREPALVSKAVAAFRGYAPIKLRRGLSNVGVLNSSIAQMANNLTWLYDKVPANIRERSKLWYVGARRVADRMSGRYGIDARQAAGVIATQSPQKDWFENVSLADRIIHIWTNYQDHAWDRHMDAAIERVTSAEALAEMADNAEGDGYDTREAAIQKLVGARLAKARKSGNELSAADARQQVLDSLTQKSEAARRLVDAVRGKKLSEVWDDKHRAVWVRVFDSAHISPHYHVVNPEGNFVGLRTTSRQTPSNIRWGTFGATAKSISILRDGTLENISNQLGAEHKIRNFYNNIIDPFNPGQDITIDTHAVAADLMMPLSGNSLPVSHNFGSSGGSTIYGLSGTYPVHHEAYSRAAAGKGVLGREMQSITWEAVRGLFTAPFKSKSANVDHVNSIWERYKSGEISQADARNEIIRYVMAKTGRTEAEIFTPEWFGSTDAPQSETSFDMKRDVPAAPLRGRVDSGIYAEVAPNPDLVKRGGSRLLAKWAALSEDEKMNVTRNVGAPIIHKVMARLGIKAYDIEFGMGGFEGETNPSITIHFGPSVPYGAQMEAAKVIGVLWKQKAMIAYDERDSGGGTQFVKVAASRPLDYNGAAELFRKITQAFPAAAGVSLRDGALVFGNFTDGAVSEQDFHDGIDAVLASLQDEKSFNTNSTTFRSDWIEPVTLEGTRYGQGNTQGDQAGRDVPGWERDFGAIQSESDERFAREVGYAFERVQARGRSAGSAGDVRDAVQRSARPSAGRGGHLDPSEPDLQRSAQGSLAERPDQPAAGGRPDRALRIQGAVHFGKAPGLSVLSGSASGTGIKGAEQERLSQAGVDPRLKRRVYFYLPVDGGIPQPEIGLGTHVYKADLDNLYDLTEGKIRGEGNPFELAVLNAGYDGYVNREQGTAVLLNRDAPVSYEGRSYDHKLVQRRIERVIPKTVTRQSGDELVRRPEASELGGVIRNREAIKAAAPSFRMEFGEARVKIDEAPAADRALEEAGSPFRFGEVSMSARDPLDDYLASRNKTLTTVTPRSVLEADIDLASNALEAAVAEIKSGNYRQMSVPIGPVPHVLRMLGFPTQMLRADMSIVKKILLDKHDDDFDAVLPRDIVMSIYRPAMVLSGRNPGEFEIISDLLTEDGPVMFVVKKDTTRGANSAKVASIMSAYAVSTGGPGDTIGKRILSGKLIYADMLTAQSAITGQKEESQSLWTGFENSEALGEGSTTGGHNSARLPQSTASGQIVQTANHLVNPRNARYARWRVVSSKILGDIAAKKIKTDVDLIGWIGRHYKGDIADVPSFSARSPIGFYSELSEQIEKSTMRQAPAAAWKTFIKALSQKGVKPDEIEWTGVNEWLDLQEGKVSKDALLDYLGANGVQVQEVVLGDFSLVDASSAAIDAEVRALIASNGYTSMARLNRAVIDGIDGAQELRNSAAEIENRRLSVDQVEPTKYAKYTLHGGENYREVLLTLPQPSTERTPAEERRLAYLERNGYGDPNDPTVGDELRAEVATLRAKNTASESYTSAHWNQKNVLAHIRVNDRTDADGARVLFVEELQSDWQQSARKQGIQKKLEPVFSLDDQRVRLVRRDEGGKQLTDVYLNDENVQTWKGSVPDDYIISDLNDVIEKRAKIGVPNAPFIDKTDKWLTLALKRIVKMAVDGGYDKVAFVNGEQSADRYDLSKHLDEVAWLPETGTVVGYKDGDDVLQKSGLSEPDLADHVGKDVAQRLLDAKTQITEQGEVIHRLRGLDLKVGGEGMKTFYDQIVPNAVKALAKKLGGEVGDVELQTGGAAQVLLGESSNQPGLTITPAMRERVEGGLPLFSKRDATWTDDRIDRLMSKYAYTMDDNRTKAYATWVRPQDFLDATTPADFKGKLESEKSPLDKDQLMREVQEIQLISRDHPKSGGVFKTEGHEGRHRMMALRDAGVERVPVTLTIPTKNGAEPLTSVFVSAQKWSGGPSAQSGFTVERMIPISWAHHDELKAEFGGEGEVSFSAKDQTKTPRFKKWFGDSKVVDADGRPLVVYHGTDEKFHDFQYGEFGFHFGNKEQAQSRGDILMPVYLSIQKPIHFDTDFGTWDEDVIAPYLVRKRIITKAEARQGDLQGLLMSKGYDGYTYPNGYEGGGTSYAVFSPTQIKSATGNNGQFDSTNPDIRRSAREDDYPLRQSSSEIVGDVGRTYTADQKAAFARVGFEVEQPSLKERARALWKDAGKKLAQGLFDQFAPVRELSQDAYGLLRLAKGSAGSFETLLKGGKLKLTDGVYDFDESQRGGVIDRLLIPMQGEHHDFLRWVAANRAEGLLAEGRENLFTQDDIDAIKTLQDGRLGFDYTLQHGPRAGSTTRVRAEMYADSLKTFNEFNKNVLDMASQSGLIDDESRHLWEGEFYVPFYRVSEEDGLQGANIKGGVVRQKAFQKLKGGKDVLNADLLDNTLMNWAHLLDASAKNRAAKATLEAAEAAGAAIPASEDIARQIGKATGNRHGVVWFMDQGMQRFYLVEDPYLMSAITSLEYAGMKNPVMNAMSAVKHYLTVGVTASPFFKVRNLIRDSVQAVASAELSYNPGKNLAEGWAASDQKGDLYFRLLAGGGTIHFGTMLEGSEARRVQALVEAGVNPDNILDNNHKLVAFYKRRIKPAIDAYNELGNRGETINRAALYKQLIAHGKSHAEASLMARDLMDFSMQGNFATIRFLTQVVPFLNARLQGLNKLGKAARENPQRTALVMGAVAMLSLSLLALYGDDDDWKKREDWDRDNFWWFKIGGIAYRVPKPFEVGAFGTLAERSAELIFSDEMTGDRFRSRVMALLGDNLSMNPVPQLVKPMLDVYANKDSFSGRPIETMGMDRLQAPYRFTANTSMTARAASTAMNAVTGLVGKESLSPVQVDSLIRGYFGWLGTFIVGGVDIVARKATDQPTRPTPDLWKVATGGMISQLDDAKSRYVSQVYDQARAIEQAYGTWRSLQKEGKTEQAADFREANIEKIQAYRNVEAIKGAMTKINQRIRDVEASDLSRDEKRDEVRRLNQRKDEFARRLAPA